MEASPTGGQGSGGKTGGPPQKSRLEKTKAWHSSRESWMDSGGSKEGTEQSCWCPGLCQLGGQWSFSWAGELWGRDRRVLEEDGQFSLDMLSLSHWRCVRPSAVWHQSPSATWFLHPTCPHPVLLSLWASCCCTNILCLPLLPLMPLQRMFSSPLSACRVPGHYLAQIPCLLRKLSDSPKKCPLRWAPSTVTDRCLALSTSSHRSVYMSMFLTRWLFYRGKELLLIILYTISMKILHCVCQLSLLGDEYLECHTVDDSGGMRAGQCGDGVLGIWKPARVKETGTRSSGWTNKKHLSQCKNSLLAWHLIS